MAITIKQHSEKWRLEIRDEVFEFDSLAKMQDALKKMLDMKSKNGDIRK